MTLGKRSQTHTMYPVVALALTVAKVLTGAMPDLPPFQAYDTPMTVRQAILETAHSVDLQGLLDWSWTHGIVVAHLGKLPHQAKKFSAIALYCNGHPVILLGSTHDDPPRLAYHLAYELGHVLEGQLQPGKPIVAQDLDKPFGLGKSTPTTGSILNGGDGMGGNSESEHAARFAMTLLTGRPDLQFKRNPHLTAQQLVPRIRDSERSTRINGGILALIYGRSAHQMRVAQDVLKVLGFDAGGRRMIAGGVQRHLPDELSPSVAALLPLIGCV